MANINQQQRDYANPNLGNEIEHFNCLNNRQYAFRPNNNLPNYYTNLRNHEVFSYANDGNALLASPDDPPSCNRVDTLEACVNEVVEEVKEKDLPRDEDFKEEEDQQEKKWVEDKKEVSTTSGEGTMACLRNTTRKNTGHRYSYMNHFRNIRLGQGSKIDPITLTSETDSKATECNTNDESWSDDEIYPKDDNEAPFKMGNSK
ncbi:hypothetical protein ACH5RR_003362 [Cinchona calisaya]|uniref:Uncharacterized protein n=1 Tax=Cinchona calisaya TaxID=153742 RepID=A0ABD3AUM1_9GENT